ncbi:DUF3868 domain-containing protein [Bacteroides sp. 519]|uniref:DUF3868 domain-containing protein n=1 Tax=Bacteroides sp. 519 TaxID=2302937 RepID=UPI0013D1E42F|nr:DUF3868 domain-containing protein [Bacteroides sp. 519]NDV57354.1 DUF3868 domain-containing protein [Bacteroides sp. 519]
MKKMKNKNNPYSIVTQNSLLKTHYFIAFIIFIACGNLSAQNYKGSVMVESTDFSERNDSLIVCFSIKVEAHAVPNCSSMYFTPELRNGKHIIDLPYVQLNSKKRSKLNARWFMIASDNWLSTYDAPQMIVNSEKYTDEQMHYAVSLPYESWMDKSGLYLRQELIGCRSTVNSYTYKLSDRVTLAPRAPYEVQPLVALATPANVAKVRNRQGSAFLDFQSGRSVILPDFRRNPVELGKINDALVDVMGDMDAQITALFIEGYASPEGKYNSNDKLAHERAVALKDYIKNRYMLGENIFTVRSVGEDWIGLKTKIEESSVAQKDRVLAIIDNKSDYDTKELQLKQLSVYNTLLRDIFPELRRVEYQIDYSVRNYTTTEARRLVGTNPENLSQLELYSVALEYGKDQPEYRKIIIETIPKYFDNDPVAMNNAAALLIENGELATAARLLEKANNLPAAWNNLGIIYMLRGELDKATGLLNQASVGGVSEAEHNLKELAKKREDELKRANR